MRVSPPAHYHASLLVTACLTVALLAPGSLLPTGGDPPGPAEQVPDDGGDLRPPWSRLQYLGELRLPSGLSYRGTEVGGLSALAWVPGSGDGSPPGTLSFVALSDDKGDTDWRGAPRMYRLEVRWPGTAVGRGSLHVTGVTLLADEAGEPLPPGSVDPEGLALGRDGLLWISSEGDARAGVDPGVRQIRPDGVTVRTLELPPAYGVGTGDPEDSRERSTGVRFNQALEALTLSPGGSLFTATENALLQDGPAASLEHGSPSRILRFDAAGGEPTGEYLYLTEPVVAAPSPADGMALNGLVELLAVDEERLLALERSYSAGRGMSIRLYLVDLSVADDVLGRDDPAAARPVAKRLLADLGDLAGHRQSPGDEAWVLDNLEGLAWGPELPDGRRTLWLVSDNNFNTFQVTQLLAFALADEPATVAGIQGAGHRSPWAGQWLEGVEGVVTHVGSGRGGAGRRLTVQLTVQSPEPDDDPATSEGLWVEVPAELVPESLSAGDRLTLAGRVVEDGRAGDLPVTTLEATRVTRTATGRALPPAVVVGVGGLHPPTVVVEDDAFEHFDPAVDGADFWEALEGMRLSVPTARVVGPSWRDGSVAVTPEGVPGTGPRSRRGGLVLTPGDANPERLFVDPPRGSPEGEVPALAVGDRFTGPLEGVLGFRFGLYRLTPTAPWPTVERPGAPRERSPRLGPREDDGGGLTVATWNVWNLGPDDGPERSARVARRIVEDLGSPAVLALQEMQDADGARDSGQVDGEPTFEALIEAIAAVGGPRYVFRQIDPLDGLEGGQPGGNIRVGFLLDPTRVTPVDRGNPHPLLPVQVLAGPDGSPRLEPSPGRLDPAHPAFAGDRERGFGRSRRPLALEVRVLDDDGRPGPRPLFLLAIHFNSKGGDDGYFSPRQPPHRPSEQQRHQQAERVAGWVRAVRTLDPRAAVVVLGDLNDHEFRSPLAVLRAAGLVNLMDRVPLEDRYTFNFRGNSQVLDHVLVTPELATGARIDLVHRDADAPYHQRASDHDPVLVRLPWPP